MIHFEILFIDPQLTGEIASSEGDEDEYGAGGFDGCEPPIWNEEDAATRLEEDIEEEILERSLMEEIGQIQCEGGVEWGEYDGDNERTCVQNEINMTCRRNMPSRENGAGVVLQGRFFVVGGRIRSVPDTGMNFV